MNGEKNGDILYTVRNGLYINLTNRCPCACTFCLRTRGQGYGDAGTLWLTHEPDMDEIKAAFDKVDLSQYDEFVFCGFGEPTEALARLLQVAAFVRARSTIRIRLNTNGLSDLIHSRPTAQLFEGLVDVVSISMNTSTPAAYLEKCRPSFGLKSFDAMLKFAVDCRRYVPSVMFTVVDFVTPPEIIAQCQKIADACGVPLRVRAYEP